MRRTHIPLAMLAAMAAMPPSSANEAIVIKPTADDTERMPVKFTRGGTFAPRIPSQAKRRKNRRRLGW